MTTTSAPGSQTIGDLPYAVDEPVARKDRWFPWILAAVAIAALAGRVIYVLTLAERDPTGGDPFYYHVQANLLADGKGFSEPFTWTLQGRLIPTAVHPPLFSMVLAVSSLLGHTEWFAHKLVACVIGTGTVVLVGLVGRQVAGATAGVIAAVLAAGYPNLWVVDGIVMPESLFGFTIALTLWLAYRFARAPRPLAAALTGVAVGLAALVRGEAVFLVVLLGVPLALWVRDMGWRARLRNLAAFVVASAVIIAPWVVRNMTSFEEPVLLSVNVDEVTRNANCNDTYYGQFVGFWSYRCYGRTPPGDESERGVEYRRRGREYIRSHLDRVPYVVGVRLGRIYDVYRPSENLLFGQIEGRDRRVSRAGQLMFWSMLAPAAVGVVALRRRRVRLVPLVAMVGLATLTAVFAYGAIRFRMPAEIAIVVFAAAGIDACLRTLRRT
jgi:asparagine N-glycosylation enzyme membrane subunit Stt3